MCSILSQDWGALHIIHIWIYTYRLIWHWQWQHKMYFFNLHLSLVHTTMAIIFWVTPTLHILLEVLTIVLRYRIDRKYEMCAYLQHSSLKLVAEYGWRKENLTIISASVNDLIIINAISLKCQQSQWKDQNQMWKGWTLGWCRGVGVLIDIWRTAGHSGRKI